MKNIDKEEEKEHNESASLQEESERNLRGWQRALADYDNCRKEADKRVGESVLKARGTMIQEIVQILENLQTAINHIPVEQKKEQWAIGLDHIVKSFEQFLESYEVNKIAVAVGDKFDHNLHEAIKTSADESFEENVIVAVVSPGYLLKDKVIKPAKVIVKA